MAVLFRDSFTNGYRLRLEGTQAEDTPGVYWSAGYQWDAYQGFARPWGSGGMLAMTRTSGDFTASFDCLFTDPTSGGNLTLCFDGYYGGSRVMLNMLTGEAYRVPDTESYPDTVMVGGTPFVWEVAFEPRPVGAPMMLTVVGREAEKSIEIFVDSVSVVRFISPSQWDTYTSLRGGLAPGLGDTLYGVYPASVAVDEALLVDGAHPPGGGVDPEPASLTASGSVFFSGEATFGPPVRESLSASGSVYLNGQATFGPPVRETLTASGSVYLTGSAVLSEPPPATPGSVRLTSDGATLTARGHVLAPVRVRLSSNGARLRARGVRIGANRIRLSALGGRLSTTAGRVRTDTRISLFSSGTMLSARADEPRDDVVTEWPAVSTPLGPDVSAYEIDGIQTRDPLRVVVVDMFGAPVAELEQAIMGSPEWLLNDHDRFDFSLPLSDEKNAHCRMYAEIQVWRGQRIHWWGPITKVDSDARTMNYQCAGLTWYFTRRFIDRRPKANLLSNGGFERRVGVPGGGWTFGYKRGSTPARAPKYRRSKKGEPTVTGARSLRLVGAGAESTFTETVSAQNLTVASATADVLKVVRRAKKRGTRRYYVTGHTEATGTPSASKAASEAYADTFREIIRDLDPGATVTTKGYGDTRPLVPNDSPANRAKNTRVEITVTTSAPASTGRQYAKQVREVSHPRSEKRPTKYTMVGWMYLEEFTATNAAQIGMALERVAPDGTIVRRTYPIDKNTPIETWIRVPLSVSVPADGQTYRLRCYLYAITGVSYFDAIALNPQERLGMYDVPQNLIAKKIVEIAQDPEHGKTDLNIQHRHLGERTQRRTRSYSYDEHASVWESLAEFPTLMDGFDVGMTWDHTTRWLTTYFPRRGKEHKNGITLAYGSNIQSYSIAIDGEQTANSIIVLADGESDTAREEGYSRNLSALNGLALEKVFSATPGSALSSLKGQADRGLGRYQRHVVIPQITTVEGNGHLLGRIRVGDVVPVSIHHDWIDQEIKVRITGIRFDPETEQITYTCEQQDEWSV